MTHSLYHVSLDPQVLALSSGINGGTPARNRAITKAAAWLAQQDTITIDSEGNLYIPSATHGRSYKVNGTCQCTAAHYGNFCWHQAVKQIVDFYRECLELAAHTAWVDAWYSEKSRPAVSAQHRRRYDELMAYLAQWDIPRRRQAAA